MRATLLKNKHLKTDRLLTLTEVADTLAVSTRKVKRMIEKGDLPSLLIGERSRRVRESVLQRFISKAAE